MLGETLQLGRLSTPYWHLLYVVTDQHERIRGEFEVPTLFFAVPYHRLQECTG